jgi:uncharacterized protein YheU (UPF0270 family)
MYPTFGSYSKYPSCKKVMQHIEPTLEFFAQSGRKTIDGGWRGFCIEKVTAGAAYIKEMLEKWSHTGEIERKAHKKIAWLRHHVQWTLSVIIWQKLTLDLVALQSKTVSAITLLLAMMKPMCGLYFHFFKRNF